SQIRLQTPCIVTLIRELVAAGVSEHVGMGLDLEPRDLTSLRNQLLEVADCDDEFELACQHDGSARVLRYPITGTRDRIRDLPGRADRLAGGGRTTPASP